MASQILTSQNNAFIKARPAQRGIFIYLFTHIQAKSKMLLAATLFLLSFWSNAQDVLVGLTSMGGAQRGGTAFTLNSNGTGFTVKRNFALLGYSPKGDLVRGKDGNFYGMTYNHVEGQLANDYGTIFKVTPAGKVTVLRKLNLNTDGGYPFGSLIQATDGNFYGLTSQGGKGYYGTAFKITPSGTFTVLHHFDYYQGGTPHGNLLQGKDGNFYGMTRKGGTGYDDYTTYGVIFRLTPAGVYTKLYVFDYNSGGQPYGSLVQDNNGNFYGMTNYGGGNPASNDVGAIFKFTPAGTFTNLYRFNFNITGGQPHGSLIRGTDGNFYGMTKYGGPDYGNYGTIFRITPTGTFTLLYHFNTNPKVDGANPDGNLVQGTDGNFYGMTENGGAHGRGTIFKITPSGAFTLLRAFNPPADGAHPTGSLIQSTDGNFYGMTAAGGTGNLGTIFKMTPAGTLTTIINLPQDPAGLTPVGNLVQGNDGNYYGATNDGGAYGYGSIFKMCNGTFSVIHSLKGKPEGSYMKSNVIQGKDGNFYGMTFNGGTYDYGTIFKLTPTGTLTVLRNLNPDTDGANPYGSLVQGSDGNFYGMTSSGGSTIDAGTIFKVTPTGTFTKLRTLNPALDGANPTGNLVQGNDGYFYGMTNKGGSKGFGTIFKITSGGTFAKLRDLDFYSTIGSSPDGSLIQGRDGYFYGMMNYGGSTSYGTIFRMTSAGAITVIHIINASEGYFPKGSLVQGSDGTMYGMMSAGGNNNAGTIFKISTAGAFAVLRHLNPVVDGSTPLSGLTIQRPNPKANSQNISTNEDTSKGITLTGSGGLPLTYTITTAPINGTLSGSGANRVYTPKANYYGEDSFYYSASWGCQTSVPVKVSITVTPVNDAPVLVPIGNKSTVLGSTLTFTATATDVDAGQSKTFSLVSALTGATIIATSGAFTWKPAAIGTYIFKVSVTDNGSPALYDEEQISVTVTTTSITTIATTINSTPKEQKALSAVLYPNPVAQKINISLNKSISYAYITIVNSKGLVVFTDKYEHLETNQLEIPATQLAPGLYSLHLQTDWGMQALKLIKL